MELSRSRLNRAQGRHGVTIAPIADGAAAFPRLPVLPASHGLNACENLSPLSPPP